MIFESIREKSRRPKTYQYIEFEKKFEKGKGIFQIRKFYLEKILEQSFYHEN